MKNESWQQNGRTTNVHVFRLMEPEEIDHLRPFLTEGFSCIQGRLKTQDFLEDMEHSIYVGATAVFIAEQEFTGEPYAFFTVTFDTSRGETVARIDSGYSPFYNEQDILEAGMQVAIDYARTVNVKKVVFHSPRRAWIRRAKSLGAELKSMTFELEV